MEADGSLGIGGYQLCCKLRGLGLRIIPLSIQKEKGAMDRKEGKGDERKVKGACTKGGKGRCPLGSETSAHLLR